MKDYHRHANTIDEAVQITIALVTRKTPFEFTPICDYDYQFSVSIENMEDLNEIVDYA